ncbi:sigma-70 family RNA polymerase sigma factor [bacterium]|nr:sigma-70 family RNA polymerase sigma factor [bacterium]
MTVTSVTLLQRVRRRDDQVAWERFVRIYTPLLVRWSQGAGLSDLDAADIVQEVFATLVVEMPQFEFDRTRGMFRSWLKTITLNLCRKQQRKRQVAEGRGGENDPLQGLLADDHDPTWDREYHEFVLRRAMQIMQSQFEPKTWQAAWELAVNRLTAAEVSQKLGISESAVYVAKSRVMRRLRQELSGLLD